jgi:hypothetical protein
MTRLLKSFPSDTGAPSGLAEASFGDPSRG